MPERPVALPNRINFNVVEATIPEMQTAMASGRVTSKDLVAAYLARIAQYEPLLNAVISVNQNAYNDADDRDRERQLGLELAYALEQATKRRVPPASAP